MTNYTHYTCIDILGQNFNTCTTFKPVLFSLQVQSDGIQAYFCGLAEYINISSKQNCLLSSVIMSVMYTIVVVHEDDIRTCRPRFIPTADNDSKW